MASLCAFFRLGSSDLLLLTTAEALDRGAVSVTLPWAGAPVFWVLLDACLQLWKASPQASPGFSVFEALRLGGRSSLPAPRSSPRPLASRSPPQTFFCLPPFLLSYGGLVASLCFFFFCLGCSDLLLLTTARATYRGAVSVTLPWAGARSSGSCCILTCCHRRLLRRSLQAISSLRLFSGSYWTDGRSAHFSPLGFYWLSRSPAGASPAPPSYAGLDSYLKRQGPWRSCQCRGADKPAFFPSASATSASTLKAA